MCCTPLPPRAGIELRVLHMLSIHSAMSHTPALYWFCIYYIYKPFIRYMSWDIFLTISLKEYKLLILMEFKLSIYAFAITSKKWLANPRSLRFTPTLFQALLQFEVFIFKLLRHFGVVSMWYDVGGLPHSFACDFPVIPALSVEVYSCVIEELCHTYTGLFLEPLFHHVCISVCIYMCVFH